MLRRLSSGLHKTPPASNEAKQATTTKTAAELLAELQRRVSLAARPTGTYENRPDRSARPFGGFKTLLSAIGGSCEP